MDGDGERGREGGKEGRREGGREGVSGDGCMGIYTAQMVLWMCSS